MRTFKMNSIWLLILISIGMLPCLFSCQDDSFESQYQRETLVDLHDLKDDNLQLKKEFSKALAKVLGENQEIREFIKKEALKRFDNDYDVLYLLIKDEKLDNGFTLEKLLLQYIKPELLKEVEDKIPTLTIYIPELPMNSFSADTWDTNKETPFVGVRVKYDSDVPLYSATGEESIIFGGQIPTYPVLVVKENERITVGNSIPSSRKIESRANNSTQFVFLDDVFNNISSSVNQSVKTMNNSFGIATRTAEEFIGGPYEISWGSGRHHFTATLPEPLRKVLDAYDIYKNYEGGWQRDYIYYNLTPSNTVGPFNYNYKEYITAFEMIGDANLNLQKISDQTGDPKRNDERYVRNRKTYWTDGEFEFKVKVYLGNKNAFGNEFTTYFRIKPEDLFSLEYIRDRTSPQNMLITGVENKKVYLSTPLFEWNLENYSANIKIAIEEVDATETIKQTSTTTADFATNFGFSTEVGKKVKLGLQFGASSKETRTTSFEVSTTNGNDELGEVIINFWDDIIVSRNISEINPNGYGPNYEITQFEGTLDYNKKYSTGWYRLYIAPKRTN